MAVSVKEKIEVIRQLLAEACFNNPRYQYVLIIRDLSQDHANLTSNILTLDGIADILKVISQAEKLDDVHWATMPDIH